MYYNSFLITLLFYLFQDKKWIIKTIRDKIMTICTHKIAYMVILALFDSVDDTVLMKKVSILKKKLYLILIIYPNIVSSD